MEPSASRRSACSSPKCCQSCLPNNNEVKGYHDLRVIPPRLKLPRTCNHWAWTYTVHSNVSKPPQLGCEAPGETSDASFRCIVPDTEKGETNDNFCHNNPDH